MAIHVALHHKTHYTYDRPVGHAPHVVRLRPAPHCRTPILSYSMKVRPAEHFINWQQDPFANWNGRLVFPEMSSRNQSEHRISYFSGCIIIPIKSNFLLRDL